jgi:hypothetical protein
MFLFSHFHGELPDTHEEFKATLSAQFPSIWDTKLLSSQSGGKYSDTQLGPLYKSCINDQSSAPVAVETAEGFGKYGDGDGEFAHEAAFDAYMTGVVLAKLMSDGLCSPAAEKMNRFYLMRSLFSLNLAGEDGVMEEGTLLHISGFEKVFTTGDLVGLFGKLRVQIRWIDDTACIAALSDNEEKGGGPEAVVREVVAQNVAQVVQKIEERVRARESSRLSLQGGGESAGELASADTAPFSLDMSRFMLRSLAEWSAAPPPPTPTPHTVSAGVANSKTPLSEGGKAAPAPPGGGGGAGGGVEGKKTRARGKGSRGAVEEEEEGEEAQKKGGAPRVPPAKRKVADTTHAHEEECEEAAGTQFTCFTGAKVQILTWGRVSAKARARNEVLSPARCTRRQSQSSAQRRVRKPQATERARARARRGGLRGLRSARWRRMSRRRMSRRRVRSLRTASSRRKSSRRAAQRSAKRKLQLLRRRPRRAKARARGRLRGSARRRLWL